MAIKKKIYRIAAAYLLLNMTAELIMPVAAHALTNGPGQPEFQSFEPAGSTEMVNLFTGDFSYNIPLMTVPGPNGGYPINLAYHAGVTMEQEASWVGLGWNINAGAINRSVRGLPDDFKGDEVIKRLHFRPSNSLVLNFGRSMGATRLKKEFLGYDQYYASGGVQVYYNNYRGIGFQFAANFALSSAEHNSSPFSSPLRVNLTSSSDGIGVNTHYSILGQADILNMCTENGLGASVSWGSREGIKSFHLAWERKTPALFLQSTSGLGISFATAGFVPRSSPEIEGFISNLSLELGPDTSFYWSASKYTSLSASYNRSWVKFVTQTHPSYGYLYNEYSTGKQDEKVLADINREKDNPPTRQSKTLGVPVATYDSYNVSAQGMGGSFRPYRSDIGIYTDPAISSEIYGRSVGSEFGIPDPSGISKVGINGSYIESKSYSGMWDNYLLADLLDEGWDVIKDYDFQHAPAGGYAYEPFYFKMAGELTAAPVNQTGFMGGAAAVRLNLQELFEDGVNINPRPVIKSDALVNNANSFDLNPADARRASREKTVTRNGSRTNTEMQRFTASVPANIYAVKNSFPALGGVATPAAYAYTTGEGHHLAEFTETGADGSRYVYGLPVYNKVTKEVMFAQAGNAAYTNDFLVPYTTTQASENNDEANTDQLYSSVETPPYAKDYLLTAVYSPDYVDITGDGPSEDDLGYYTKFNYVLVNNAFKWRAPYGGAFMNAGFLSDVNDDKLSYQYGEKEVYLLHSIETKTHAACFFLNDGRKDGHEAVSENTISPNPGGVSSSDKLFALDSILLFSKNDPGYGSSAAVPVKAVHFTYDYSLCSSVDNNENTVANTGKLTLKEIYFTYQKNRKGKLSPYQFTYGVNPAYNVLGNDRWGTYQQQDALSTVRNNENPYTDQRNRLAADQYAAAWALSAIALPSGSVININYEADDYAYVQDKRAMQMCRVVGFCDENIPNPSVAAIGEEISKRRTRLVFELNEPIPYAAADKHAQVYQYIEGIREMYFKLFVALKAPYGNPSGADLYDYVDGFCRINGNYDVINDGSNDHKYAYVTVDLVDRDDYPNLPGAQVNPVQKATWQYMYLERPDLFANPDIASGTIANIASAANLVSIVGELGRAVAPYITANVRGWGDRLDIDPATFECAIRPSYVRLNSPRWKKTGGGHRVKQILITDSWENISGHAGTDGNYGQSYAYVLADGKSSGVASYEPMIGGEENAMCMPIRYNSENLVKKDEAFYVMAPIGESYYPAPLVGYSRVIVSSINQLDRVGNPVSVSRTGKTEYEFYTSKDYPVYTDRTDLQKTWFPVPVIIPFVGSITHNTRGFSQGFVVELNDMHGKLKAVSMYPAYANLENSVPIPTRRVFYKYNGGYEANKYNRLSSTVQVLTADGVYQQANLGETYDLFFDLRQFSNRTQELGGQVNITQFPSGVIPTFLPAVNISKSMFRSAATMKVIYRTGILTEVETMDDGARSTARNLMFDAETGAPLLTVVENEFERPVYTYNYAAHWAYEGMQAAYKNQGARFYNTSTSGGVLTVTNAEQYFYAGDEVMFIPSSGPGTMLWATGVSGSAVTLVDASGSSAGNLSGSFIIHRSGRRNLQSVSNGVIVSLSNPVTARTSPFFDAFNSFSGTLPGSDTTTLANFYTDCATGEARNVRFAWNSGLNRLVILVIGQGCEAYIEFPSGFVSSLADAFTCNLQYTGTDVLATKTVGGNPVTVDCNWVNSSSCFTQCLDDVLHASAVRFAENWSSDVAGHAQKINFADAGVTPTANNYKSGLRGVWRTHSNYLYQVDRKQTTGSASKTDISKDGTYKHFVLYDWQVAARDNTQWSFVSAVTRYSPYGYALETRDALGIYSSVMYGYDNTKQTAAAANAQYFEMAFDGFEDYASGYSGHGHWLFTDANPSLPSSLTTGYAHTGTKSLAVEPGGDAEYTIYCSGGAYASSQQYFEPQLGQEYFFSVWARATGGGTPAVTIDNGSGPVTYTPDAAVSPIEGWRKIDVKFTAPASPGTLSIKLQCQNAGFALFDDVRVQPFKSAMTSYVYDPQTHWLLAGLDNRNYATFYNYDEEGALVQVKQETERGIFTVQTSRGNIIRQ